LKFPDFDYVRASTVDDAIGRLADDDEARILAGGQSLLPLMALRLARPRVVIDITGLGLDGVETVHTEEGPILRVGALVRHSRLVTDPVVAEAAPLLSAAAAHVGHPAIRHRGTLGGSLAHADPAAELPAAAVALGASVTVEGPAGRRRLASTDLADGHYSTSLEPGEVVIAVEVPVAGPGHGAAFCEWAVRVGDFAEAGVGVAVETDPDGVFRTVRAAACGIAARPVPLSEELAPVVVGAAGDEPALLRSVAGAVEAAAEQAGANDDKAELAGLLAARSLHRAWRSSRRSPAGVGG
jgi:carbon-monoxide dehydrogenase medium subunit